MNITVLEVVFRNDNQYEYSKKVEINGVKEKWKCQEEMKYKGA